MKEKILSDFGKRVRQLRKESSLSQEQLAERTGFHRTYIGMVERGERNPALVNIKVFADSLNVSLSKLFNDKSFEKEVENGKEK
ncbi:helix-turn-helix domain-containing protein [Psychrobacter alimentarius]|uniref:helix-turn-helix domain-containing protein n=1 Tax=Psychrobacter alimentarius TaxID=261164 RepID=UPI0019189DB5|nr:helix-turn-helix transcriptional regulator [Psychrobacter alimentarius]